jgi:hypothetical protein
MSKSKDSDTVNVVLTRETAQDLLNLANSHPILMHIAIMVTVKQAVETALATPSN